MFQKLSRSAVDSIEPYLVGNISIQFSLVFHVEFPIQYYHIVHEMNSL